MSGRRSARGTQRREKEPCLALINTPNTAGAAGRLLTFAGVPFVGFVPGDDAYRAVVISALPFFGCDLIGNGVFEGRVYGDDDGAPALKQLRPLAADEQNTSCAVVGWHYP